MERIENLVEMNTMREQFKMRYGKLISRSQRLVVENVKVSSVHCMFVLILFNELAMMVSATITLPWWMDICSYDCVFLSISMDFTCTHTIIRSVCTVFVFVIHTKHSNKIWKGSFSNFFLSKNVCDKIVAYIRNKNVIIVFQLISRNLHYWSISSSISNK